MFPKISHFLLSQIRKERICSCNNSSNNTLVSIIFPEQNSGKKNRINSSSISTYSKIFG